MFGVIFSGLWTVFTAGVAIGVLTLSWREGSPASEDFLILLFPLFGVLMLRRTLRRYRRGQSLRVEVEGGVRFYVWTELDGSERRSEIDPTPDWDAADGDGGDGGGD